MWRHYNLPTPTPLQYDIARFLQHGPSKAIIQALRGVGKSYITVAFVAWCLYCNPQSRILVVSATQKFAVDFSTMLLGLIEEMELLAHLRPRPDQRSSVLSFDVGPAQVEKTPSVNSLGISGQLTGNRADIIVADDIETATNSGTQAARDGLAEIVKEFSNILKPLASSKIIFLGTPHNEDSLYNKLLERGYTARIWPARYPKTDKLVKYGARLAPFIALPLAKDPALEGQPTEPSRFHEDKLLELELENGRSGFALQFMLDTSLSDAEKYPLRLTDLVVLPLDTIRGPVDLAWGSSKNLRYDDLPNVGIAPDAFYGPAFVSQGQYDAFQGSIMYVDPSGKGRDETAYAVVKMLNGRLFLTAAGGFLGGYSDETLDLLVWTARKQDVNHILVEPNFGGGMFAKLLQARAVNVHPCTVEDSKWSRGQKETRIIDTLEPVLNQHRLVVDKALIAADYRSTESYKAQEVSRRRLFYQLTRITRDKGSLAHDDRLEAVAGAVAYWVEQMTQNTEKAVLDHKEDLLDRELENFMEHALGRPRDAGGHYRSTSARGRLH